MGGVLRRLASPEAMAPYTLAIAFLVYLTGTSLIVFFSASRVPLVDLAASALMSTLVFGVLLACRAPLMRVPRAGWRASAIVAIVLLNTPSHPNDQRIAPHPCGNDRRRRIGPPAQSVQGVHG